MSSGSENVEGVEVIKPFFWNRLETGEAGGLDSTRATNAPPCPAIETGSTDLRIYGGDITSFYSRVCSTFVGRAGIQTVLSRRSPIVSEDYDNTVNQRSPD